MLTATGRRLVSPGLTTGAEPAFSVFTLVSIVMVGATSVAPLLTEQLSGSLATSVACLALLIFGLPHGTLDLDLMTDLQGGRRARVLILYLALAAAMYGLWRWQPLCALIAFFALSLAHFAEDWQATGSRLLSAGMAGALLSAPAIVHREALAVLITDLTATPSAAIVPQLLFIIMPVAFALAAVALASLWQQGAHRIAIDGLATLCAMTVLPPVIGFALFFCLAHSPRHLSQAMRDLGGDRWALWRDAVVPLSAASFAIAASIFMAMPHAAMPTSVMATCFITLSVLTLPHMAVPMLLRAIDRR